MSGKRIEKCITCGSVSGLACRDDGKWMCAVCALRSYEKLRDSIWSVIPILLDKPYEAVEYLKKEFGK